MIERWDVIKEIGGVRMEHCALRTAHPSAGRWRIRNERGEMFPMPDEAAAIASFSLELRRSICRARETASALNAA